MGEVKERSGRWSASAVRAAPPGAWLLALASVVVAALMASTVPDDLPVLRGLPMVVAWAGVALLVAGLATGGQRLAPVAAVAVPLAAIAALLDQGGGSGPEPVLLGGAGWLCLELCASSLEARPRRRRGAATIRRRLGDQLAVVVAGASVGVLALSVETELRATAIALRAAGALAASGLLLLMVWSASSSPEG